MLTICVTFLLLFCVVFSHCSFTLFLHVVVSHCWGIFYCVIDANVIVGPSHYLCYCWFITLLMLLLVCCVDNAFIILSSLLVLLLVHRVANVVLVCCIVGVVVGPSRC
jgi:hypothetical protein